jgi:hypothetical protein
MHKRRQWAGWLVRAMLVALVAVLSDARALAGDTDLTGSGAFSPSLLLPTPEASAVSPATTSALAQNPFSLDDLPAETIYGEPEPQTNEPRSNNGATHLQLDFQYNNHYLYRGVDHSLVAGRGDSANLESQGTVSFDIGPLTPFVGVFSNVFDSDPLSRFQEIRPYFGGSLNLRPLTISAGDNAYLYPERRAFDTSEVWTKFQLDDGYVFGLDKPILNPSFYGAYDYDKNKGWYFEVAVQHDFAIEQTGLTLSPFADVGYIYNYQEQFVFINDKDDTGFQHYDIGLIATYSLNAWMNIPQRYGEFDLTGRFVDTSRIRKVLDADNVVWGGVGVEFRY